MAASKQVSRDGNAARSLQLPASGVPFGRYLLLDSDPRQGLDRRHQRRVIEIAISRRADRIHQLRDECRHRQRRALIAGGAKNDVEIFAMQIDPESWHELILDHPWPAR